MQNMMHGNIPAHIAGQQTVAQLGLRQVDGFIPPREILVHGQKWKLIRDSKSPLAAVPNLNMMEWHFGDNMELQFFDPAVYWYCLHGIKKPSSPNEPPLRMLFQWFHTQRLPINPRSISEADWQRANVYVCEVGQFESDFCAAMFGAYSQMQAQAPIWPDVIESRLMLGQQPPAHPAPQQTASAEQAAPIKANNRQQQAKEGE